MSDRRIGTHTIGLARPPLLQLVQRPERLIVVRSRVGEGMGPMLAVVEETGAGTGRGQREERVHQKGGT